MGNQKQKWTAEEEEALLNGVAKHGPGKWKNILRDPDFAPFLTQRSNIDLKDKWRNLSVSNADKSRPKAKILTLTLPSKTDTQNSAGVPSDALLDDVLINAADGKNVHRYDAMIFEVLSIIKDPNGCDISTFLRFIEQRHEVPQNFRRSLGARLRKLALKGKLEKVQNGYRISRNTELGTRTPLPKQKDFKPPKPKDARPRQLQYSGLTSVETMKEAAISAAYKIAEAENKSFLAAEAVKEAERVSKMAEDTDSMHQLVKDIYELCSRGKIVLLA